jgi:hypothetical protein
MLMRGLKEVKQLRSLTKANTPTGVISLKMQRPSASIVSKAQREGIFAKADQSLAMQSTEEGGAEMVPQGRGPHRGRSAAFSSGISCIVLRLDKSRAWANGECVLVPVVRQAKRECDRAQIARFGFEKQPPPRP